MEQDTYMGDSTLIEAVLTGVKLNKANLGAASLIGANLSSTTLLGQLYGCRP